MSPSRTTKPRSAPKGARRPTSRKAALRKASAKRPARTTSSRNPARAAPARKPARAPAPSAAPRRPASRADFGAHIDGFFARQPPGHRAILEALRALVDEAAPDAASSLKWGMPVYTLGGKMFCALGSHKAHVNLVMAGPPSAFADPDGRLAGQGDGRHLRLTALEELPRDQVRGWLRVAVEAARAKLG